MFTPKDLKNPTELGLLIDVMNIHVLGLQLSFTSEQINQILSEIYRKRQEILDILEIMKQNRETIKLLDYQRYLSLKHNINETDNITIKDIIDETLINENLDYSSKIYKSKINLDNVLNDLNKLNINDNNNDKKLYKQDISLYEKNNKKKQKK